MHQGMNFGGYAYELEGAASECWADCADAYWDVVMASTDDKRAVSMLGAREIDGTTRMAFECADGKVRAVTMIAAYAMQQTRGP